MDSTQYIYGVLPVEVAGVIDAWTPRVWSKAVAEVARSMVRASAPPTPERAKALLFATARLAVFGEAVGLALTPDVLLHPSVIERCCAPGQTTMSAPTRRTVRTNLRYVARRVADGPPAALISRERSKQPYTEVEIASYLALADAQPTEARRHRACALICLGAGAGLMGADLRGVRGSDVACRFGAVVVVVSGRRPRVVPVRSAFSERLISAAHFAREGLVIGGVNPLRNNVTTPLTASLAGGRDLPRICLGRLRATWLVAAAETIGLRAFMDAAGITCSQRLGDLVASLPAVGEERAVTLLGARR